jgi:hypothetical protein
VLENSVTVVVDCYDIVTTATHICKSDTNRCNCVENLVRVKIIIIIIIIIVIIINCKWVDTRWQWSIYVLRMQGLEG